MPSFFDLQKFAAIGIASADMTAFDKMRALAAFGGGKTQTLTDVPPLSFKANGKPLISWSMSGNGQQQGTPTPDAPIMPTFCGVRTANLFDKTFASGYNLASNGKPTEYTNDARCATLEPIDVSGVSTVTFSFTNTLRSDMKKYIYSLFDGSTLVTRVSNQESGSTIDVSQGDKLYLCVYSSLSSVNAAETTTDIMLNTGSTALPYEPFGWAEKITCAGQTVPIYLGEVPTVRRIRKYELTGNETFYASSQTSVYYTTQISAVCNKSVTYKTGCIINAYKIRKQSTAANLLDGEFTTDTNGYLWFRNYDYATVADFKSYLAAQYAAGTPVCIWYVLAEPETAIVNEPLAKIGDYADELHSEDAAVTIPTAKGANTLTIDTELQPSEMTITFKG